MEHLQESNQKFQKTFNGKEKIMDISIVPVSRVFKTYQGQARIAELNSKNPVKRVQGQRDRVSISKEARTALTSHTQGRSPELETRKVEAQFVQTQFVQTEEVEAEKNEENEPEPSAV